MTGLNVAPKAESIYCSPLSRKWFLTPDVRCEQCLCCKEQKTKWTEVLENRWVFVLQSGLSRRVRQNYTEGSRDPHCASTQEQRSRHCCPRHRGARATQEDTRLSNTVRANALTLREETEQAGLRQRGRGADAPLPPVAAEASQHLPRSTPGDRNGERRGPLLLVKSYCRPGRTRTWQSRVKGLRPRDASPDTAFDQPLPKCLSTTGYQFLPHREYVGAFSSTSLMTTYIITLQKMLQLDEQQGNMLSSFAFPWLGVKLHWVSCL